MRRSIEIKQRQVEELKGMLKKYRTVMVANIEGVPASMMQELRKKLKGKAIIKVYKNTVIVRALEGTPLPQFVEGHPSAVILSDEDPVVLFREITSLRDVAPLRPNKPSPVDVTLQKGPVPVPVTMLSEVKAAGIPVRSVKGSVEVEKDITVIKKGDIVDEKLAKVLEIMGVKPVVIYLRVLAAYADGLLYREDVLGITEEDVLNWIKEASAHAFNLSYNAGYPTKLTVPLMLSDAHRKAVNLAVNAGILTKETAPLILSTAHAKALSLASILPKEVTGVEIASPPVEEKKGEEEGGEEEEKEEEKKEEEATEGLASLFG